MTNKRFTGWMFVLIGLSPAWVGAMPFSDIVVLGDSLSDQGNVSIITVGAIPPPEYTDGTNNGRFTNGLNYVDYLASDLAHDVSPSVTGGTNYAYGGARTDFHPLSGFGAKSLLEQRGTFTDSLGGGSADSNALYIIWGGANDVRDIALNVLADPSFDPLPGVTKAVSDLAEVVSSVVGLGAVDIIVPNLPDLGIVPLITGGGPPVPEATALATGFNSAFDLALDAILQSFPDTNLIRFDSFGLLRQAFDAPDAFGFNVVNAPCYSKFVETGGDTCGSPDDYLSWDGFHPTTASHRIIANQMLALVSVPEPGSLALLFLGFAGLGLSRSGRFGFRTSRARLGD